MKRSVFYLDDEAACVELFREMFGEDYDVRIATRLADARRLLGERPADIVISDQRMPDIEGSAFLREVSDLYPASFRVMLTGSVTVGDMIQEISGGVVNLFIAKPWTEPNMRQILERASASYELRSKARQARAAARQPDGDGDRVSSAA